MRISAFVCSLALARAMTFCSCLILRTQERTDLQAKLQQAEAETAALQAKLDAQAAGSTPVSNATRDASNPFSLGQGVTSPMSNDGQGSPSPPTSPQAASEGQEDTLAGLQAKVRLRAHTKSILRVTKSILRVTKSILRVTKSILRVTKSILRAHSAALRGNDKAFTSYVSACFTVLLENDAIRVCVCACVCVSVCVCVCVSVAVCAARLHRCRKK